MTTIRGKKILFIAPNYYGYEKHIIHGLEKLGAIVYYAENRPFQHDPINKGTKWYVSILCKKASYIRKVLIPLVKRDKFDLCLFVDLFSFDHLLVTNLRKKNPDIKCILYLWDNIRGYKWPQFFSSFDKIFSFDPIESKEFELTYLPNFYTGSLSNEKETNCLYDFSFIGSLQVHRLRILEDMAMQLKQENKRYFFYLYLHPNYNRLKFNRYINWILQLFPKRFKGYKLFYNLITQKKRNEIVHYQPLSLSDSVKSIASSNCILDLPFPGQTGSTQRLVQALAFNKKVITTNASVIHESFYNPGYIKVARVENFSVDWQWVNEKNDTRMDISGLHIDNWLIQLLSSWQNNSYQ